MLGLDGFAIPTGDADHDTHAYKDFQEIVELVLADQLAGAALEGALHHTHFLANQNVGLGGSHEYGTGKTGVAEHTELGHLLTADFCVVLVAGQAEDADGYGALTKQGGGLLGGAALLHEQEVVYGGYQGGIVGMVGRIATKGHGDEVGDSLVGKETAHFLFLTVEGAEGVPGRRLHEDRWV